MDLYGLMDVLALLALAHPRLHIARLADWTGRVIGDGDLAARMAQIAGAPGSEHERHVALAGVLERRLLQAADALYQARA